MTSIDQTSMARPKHGMLKAVDDSVSKGSDSAFSAFMLRTGPPEARDRLPVHRGEGSNLDEGSDAVALPAPPVPTDDPSTAGRFDPSQSDGDSRLLVAQGAPAAAFGDTGDEGAVDQPDGATGEALFETSSDAQASSAGMIRGDTGSARFDPQAGHPWPISPNDAVPSIVEKALLAAEKLQPVATIGTFGPIASAAVLNPLVPEVPMTDAAAGMPTFQAEGHPSQSADIQQISRPSDLVTTLESAESILPKLALSEKTAASASTRDNPVQTQAVVPTPALLQASSDLPSLPSRGAIALETQVAPFIAQTHPVSVTPGSPILADGAGASVPQVLLGARFNALSLDFENVTGVSGHAATASGPGSLPSLAAVSGNITPSPWPMPAIIAQIREHSATGKPSVMEVTLSPEDLGKIRLHITPDGDKLRIVLQVERPETLELLRRNTESFAMELRQAGFAGTSFSFGNWNDGRDQNQTSNRAAGSDNDEGPTTFVTLTHPRYQATAHGGLDLRV